jgi:hypothetical protein
MAKWGLYNRNFSIKFYMDKKIFHLYAAALNTELKLYFLILRSFQ